MSGRLQQIENKIEMMDSASFQSLCDVYLHNREKGLISISRTGSQIGKLKTVAGTPDTFYRTKKGDLIHVEATTKATGTASKLIKDFEKCLDESITGIHSDEIDRIILCFNTRLSPKQESEVYSYARKKNKDVELIGLDYLALDIYNRYGYIQNDLLGIPFDTGQILSLDKFVAEYDNKCNNLSTPLNNLFLHRTKELTEIVQSLNTTDITIISGDPGIGKTKIGLHVVKMFLDSNTSYQAFVISKKDVDIFDDLKITLIPENDYLLLIDDANRQLINLEQILGLFKGERKGRLKLLITVRNYALNELNKVFFDFKYALYELKKFTDEEIIDIIKSDSFNIRNQDFQKKIVEIADGNARLAIMAARLANIMQIEFLFTSVEVLYDTYYQHFARDLELFENKDALRCLALICFFYTLDLKDKSFLETLLGLFQIERKFFLDTVHELEKHELVEVHHNIVKVSEQVMATYIFYKVFIKDKLLPFNLLLINYFPTSTSKFSDSVIASNNAFGFDNVISRISDDLTNYINTIKINEDLLLKFFDVFWFYKQEAVLEYFSDQINKSASNTKQDISTDYKINDYAFNADKTINFLSKFFNYPTNNYSTALELCFEYCRKQPAHLPELIKTINDTIIFKVQDQRTGFYRQTELINLVCNKIKQGDQLYTKAFFAIVKVFLAYTFQITEGGRRMTISFYQYPLPLTEDITILRKHIFDTLFELSTNFRSEVIDVLQHHIMHNRTINNKEVLENDLPQITKLITDVLTKDNVQHIHIVQDYTLWLNRQHLSNKDYQFLNNIFYSKEYELFCNLSWDRIRDKYEYEFDNFEDYQKLKSNEIRRIFLFTSVNDFTLLFKAIDSFVQLKSNDTYNLNNSIDLIVENNFSTNPEIGYQLFISIISRYGDKVGVLYKSIGIITNHNESYAQRIWDFIAVWENDYKVHYQLQILFHIPDHLLTQKHKKTLVNSFKEVQTLSSLYIESLHKFTNLDRIDIRYKVNNYLSKIPFVRTVLRDHYGLYFPTNCTEEIVQTAFNLIVNTKRHLRIHDDIFEKQFNQIKHNYNLVTSLYLNQVEMDSSYDYDRKGLFTIVSYYPSFFLIYITHFYSKRDFLSHNIHDQLGFIWNIENSIAVVEVAINAIVDSTKYWGISETPLNNFFTNINSEQKIKAKQFIRLYISKYHGNSKYMNGIFDVLNHSMEEFFEIEFKYFLSIETDIKIFKEISWNGRGGTYFGNVNIGEIQASRWKKILEIINSCENKLELIPIKHFVSERIAGELKNAEYERLRNFTDSFYK